MSQAFIEYIGRPGSELELLKVHDVVEIGGSSICFGSVIWKDRPRYALYIIGPNSDVWITDPRDFSRGIQNRQLLESRIRITADMAQKGCYKYEDDEEAIPIEIATMGSSGIAAYLFAVSGYTLQEISEVMGLNSRDSVRKYLRRYQRNENIAGIFPDYDLEMMSR
ncbi:hypothetical protein [Salinirubrum litoreum]|uniref:Uncharacterized protein n=1 Tax=Salinirubrum litoreum TaxID=1126234 RepID=A0ABD5R664_9EURY|nr:hypothetical protein [Salinirubrum litoreum]